ncbi:acyltransferase domain-containing protein [Microlunatus speluncae]|uniref:acyltransferase domain-containing protein n=1 Tax=Microlunatus speluncae TaxID=2594267 RepID=UPI0012666740|nr:acyltransferase domain-containing protein [Microlunatus speluncae]
MSRADLPHIQQLVGELRLPASAVLPLYELARHAPSEPVRLPDDAELDRELDRLGLSAADRTDLLAARPDPQRTPGLWWLLERCVTVLRARQGTIAPLSPWPDLPDELGPVGRYLYVWVLIAALPAARAHHRARGIPEQSSREVLAVLADQLRNRRALHGSGGLHTQNWLTHHYRGAVYVLGRLHVERTMITFDPGPGPDAPPIGAPALALHIPEGRLTPESCDDSLTRAAAFFGRHFPEEPYRYAVCGSWVLDPQLKEYLDPESNIIKFQERFTLAPDTGPDLNETVVEFIFKRPFADLDVLPRDTSLQRGIVDHVKAGRTWRFRTGWFRLSAAARQGAE